MVAVSGRLFGFALRDKNPLSSFSYTKIRTFNPLPLHFTCPPFPASHPLHHLHQAILTRPGRPFEQPGAVEEQTPAGV